MTACAASAIALALATAKDGDVVVATGEAGLVTIMGKAWPTGVSLDLTGATLGTLTLNNVQGLTVKGGRFTATDWRGGIYVSSGSSRIVIDGAHIVGNDTNVPGITLRGSSQIQVLNARIEHIGVGCNILSSSDISLSNVAIWAVCVDGIEVSASSNVTIDGCTVAGGSVIDQLHPDAIQVMNPVNVGGVPVKNLTVRNCLLHGPTQGVTAFAGGLQGCLVENCTIALSYPQGLAFTDSMGVVLRNNRLRTLPGAAYQTRINLVNCPDAVFSGNTTDAYQAWAAQSL